MILVAGGDSFIFGAELQDQINGPSLSTYPALLAKEHDIDYHCAAWSGNANNAISRMTIEACERFKSKNRPLLALVTWTFANRYEFRFNYNTKQRISPWYSINAWTTAHNVIDIQKEYKTENIFILNAQKQNIKLAQQTGVAEFAEMFFKHVGDSEYYEIYLALKEIVFLQNYFVTNNIPYLFIPADNCFYNHPNYYRQKDAYLDSLYNQINWNEWFFFEPGIRPNETQEPRGFYQWAIENKYPVGTTHPLEEAHAAAANLIKEKFNELVTKSLEQN
jgi:hypothetical protein